MANPTTAVEAGAYAQEELLRTCDSNNLFVLLVPGPGGNINIITNWPESNAQELAQLLGEASESVTQAYAN